MSLTPTPESVFARAAIRGTAWRYITYFSGKLMIFIGTIALARLLSKDDFGVVGYALTAIAFLDVVSDLGVSPALIYYPENERTSTTAFWIGQAIAWALFGLTWVLAPLMAIYFRDDRVIPVVRVLALTYPFNALGETHGAVLYKKLDFGRTFLPDLSQAITKGVVSVVLAFAGFGAWSLVWGQVSGALISSIAFWFAYPWRPAFKFDLEAAGPLVTYGMKYVGSSVLAMLLLNLDYLLVGRYLGSEALGVYTLAFRLPELLILQFARILSTVIFPIYTKMRDIPGSLTRGFLLTTRYVSLLSIPLGIGLALIARPFTIVVLSEKWVDAIPAMQAIAIYATLLSLTYNSGSAYKAEGHPQVNTYLGLLRLAFLFPALWWAVNIAKSIVAVGWMQAATALIAGTMNMFVVTRFLKFPLRDIWKALQPAIRASFFMALSVLISLRVLNDFMSIWQLIVSVLAGAATYLGVLWYFNRADIYDITKQLQKAMNKGG